MRHSWLPREQCAGRFTYVCRREGLWWIPCFRLCLMAFVVATVLWMEVLWMESKSFFQKVEQESQWKTQTRRQECLWLLVESSQYPIPSWSKRFASFQAVRSWASCSTSTDFEPWVDSLYWDRSNRDGRRKKRKTWYALRSFLERIQQSCVWCLGLVGMILMNPPFYEKIAKGFTLCKTFARGQPRSNVDGSTAFWRFEDVEYLLLGFRKKVRWNFD